jgi:hypothetical protein
MNEQIQIPVREPSSSDTAPVAEGHNSCEGSDCINYDFPFDLRVKGKLPLAVEKD